MKKYRTTEEWRKLISKQKASGLSAVSFSKAEGIHPNFFYKKRRELCTTEAQQAFVELKTSIPKQINQIKNGTKIKIGRIEILPGNLSDHQQLLALMKIALEATDAEL